jgi:hypothetical protein
MAQSVHIAAQMATNENSTSRSYGVQSKHAARSSFRPAHTAKGRGAESVEYQRVERWRDKKGEGDAAYIFFVYVSVISYTTL